MTKAPWRQADSQYVGWIPNVLGHLSFSLIGKETSLRSFGCASEQAKTNVLRVAAYQRRVVDDYALPSWLRSLIDPSNVHDWIVTANTAEGKYPSVKPAAAHAEQAWFVDTRGVLRGHIALVAYSRPREKPGEKASLSARMGRWARFAWARTKMRWAMKSHVRACNRGKVTTIKQNRRVHSILDRFRSQGFPVPVIEFALFRTGELRLWLNSAAKGSAMPSDRKSEYHMLKVAYFFLKDILHKHAHHHHSEDKILPLVKLDAEEIHWQRQTMWHLARAVEEKIRKQTRDSLREALGIIPYAENFNALYSRSYRNSALDDGYEKTEKLDNYLFEGMRKSATVQLEARSWYLTILTGAVGSLFALVLSTIIAVSNFVRPAETHWPVEVQNCVATYPLAILAFVPLLLWFIYSAIFRELRTVGVLFTPTRSIFRFSKALLISICRRTGLSLSLGLVLLVGFYMVLISLVFWGASTLVFGPYACEAWTGAQPHFSIIMQ